VSVPTTVRLSARELLQAVSAFCARCEASRRHCLVMHAGVSLVTSLVLTKLDYCNSLLVAFLQSS